MRETMVRYILRLPRAKRFVWSPSIDLSDRRVAAELTAFSSN